MPLHDEGDSDVVTSLLTAKERLEIEVLTRCWGVVLGLMLFAYKQYKF